MREREAIYGGIDISKTLATMNSIMPELPQGATLHQDVKLYELIGLANFGAWNIFKAEDLNLNYSDSEEVSHLMMMLESSSFPFGEGLFENTEVFLLSGMLFDHRIDTENITGGTVLTYQPPINGITPGVCVSPEATLYANRVIISLSNGIPGFPHELGHVWFFKQFTNPHGIKNIHVTYAGFRRPAVPANLLEKPDLTLDDKEINNGNINLPWNQSPHEALPEDFANMFFPDAKIGRWQHKWSNIFLPGKENEAIREHLKNFFLTVPGRFDEFNSLKLDTLPKFGTTEITGTTKPGVKVLLITDDDNTTRVIDETMSGLDGRFLLKIDPNLITEGKGRLFRIALDFSMIKESTWKEILVYR
ncbi:MAG: hypothetical protein A4E53_03369 [Pelotomaculum sp. PtaB.Bin104]|nr:MAG: hypothetical protein A4E53_03369 [Pelotomaculum sp. PtaB.Bin104]